MWNSRKNSAWFIAGLVLWGLAAIGVGYGVYVTFFYDGVTPGLIPFVAISLLGALLSAVGTKKPQSLLVVLGLVLMAFAPTGFFWFCNVCAVLGAVVCAAGFRAAKNSASRDI